MLRLTLYVKFLKAVSRCCHSLRKQRSFFTPGPKGVLLTKRHLGRNQRRTAVFEGQCCHEYHLPYGCPVLDSSWGCLSQCSFYIVLPHRKISHCWSLRIFKTFSIYRTQLSWNRSNFLLQIPTQLLFGCTNTGTERYVVNIVNTVDKTFIASTTVDNIGGTTFCFSFCLVNTACSLTYLNSSHVI